MVDEYLSEREQAEQLRHWLRENWVWLVAGVALTLAGYFGWRWWETREASRSREAGEQFSAMLEALGANQRDEGRRLGSEITRNYDGTPYADQAELVLARVAVESGDLADAAERLARVADGAEDPDLRLVAKLRLARVELAQGRYDAALETLGGVESPEIEARVLELEGDVQLAKGDKAAALESWREAQAAAAAPDARPIVDAELLRLKIDELAASESTE
jgi:predicted negative regulator of RcsB-dependent stress response